MISTTKMCSTMLAMALLSVNAEASGFAGSYTRTSVSPDECDVSDDCRYQCSASYSITESGSTLTIKPTSTPTDEDCECPTLSATVSGTSASGTYADVLSYYLDQTNSGITVETTLEGMTCEGTYSRSGITISTSSTSSTTTTTTTTTTNNAWTRGGADLLGLIMTGVAIFYHG